MKKMMMMAALGVATTAVLTGCATTAGSGRAVSLFDGKTLDGWIQKNGTATYVVKDGTVLGTTVEGSPNSFLCTEKEYGDFELTVEVLLNNNELNSGIQIRSTTAAAEGGAPFGRVNGPQVEIEAAGAEGAQAGYIYGEACGGWMTADAEAKRSKAFKDGEWNEYRIKAEGARIQTWINGEVVEDLTDSAKFLSHPKGFIALQVHGIGAGQGPYSVQWRNIKIKELK